MRKIVEYCCQYCEERFSSPEDCEEHEKTHMRDYTYATNEEIIGELQRISDVAWGYRIDRQILGMPYPNFQSLIKTIIDRIEGIEDD